MKTTYLKIAALVLAGACCINPYLSDAKSKVDPPKSTKTGSVSSRKISSKTLASMKIKNIEFGFNKASVPSSAYDNLDKVAKLMNDNNVSVKLGGYADNKGGYVYNWKLSKSRADAVKAYLVSKGSDSTRIAAVEYGYTHPIASNSTATGRKKNRRVEVHFAE
jgi:outer membrane protein OmpA-like peptidoglycan-associated protein